MLSSSRNISSLISKLPTELFKIKMTQPPGSCLQAPSAAPSPGRADVGSAGRRKVGKALHPLESEFRGSKSKRPLMVQFAAAPGAIWCPRVFREFHLRHRPSPRLPEASSPPLLGLFTSRREPAAEMGSWDHFLWESGGSSTMSPRWMDLFPAGLWGGAGGPSQDRACPAASASLPTGSTEPTPT